MTNIAHDFGRIDIYLFDQVLRGRIAPGMRIFDAGCGTGRNLVYFLRAGYDVSAADEDADAIRAVRQLAHSLAPALPDDHFRVESIESLSFAADSADVVICNAVLHFARTEEQFLRVLEGAWRILALQGLFFCRLASSIGIENQILPLGGRRHALPDGSERYLVDGAYLHRLAKRLGGGAVDPLKTSIVEGQRAMTTWVLRKG